MNRFITHIGVGIFMFLYTVATAGTNVSGTIGSNTTWTASGSPYIVTGGNLLVDTLTTLTIQPGVTVMLDSARCILVKGFLNAAGTATDSIIFTRSGTASWARIWLQAGISRFTYCRIEYANSSAIYNQHADSLYVRYCTISNNSAVASGGNGGGICNLTYASIGNSTISNNIAAYESEGGGIYNNGTAVINGNTIADNSALSGGGGGGGIANYLQGTVTITNNSITGNTAQDGGGILNIGDVGGSTAIITGNTIANNIAQAGGGIDGSGILSIIGNTITGNSISYGVSYEIIDGGGGLEISPYDGSIIRFNTITETDTFAAVSLIYGPGLYFRTNNIAAAHRVFDDVGSMNFDVRYNYWNSVNTDTLNAKIHDYFDDYNRGIANYQPFLKAPFSDTTAPAKPLNLAANGSNPSHGASDSTFIITWNNPPDPSGIAEYYYKLYTPPTSVFDTTAVFHHASPDTLKSQGGPLYVWLVDSSGNMDYHNDDSVLLNVSAVREQEKIAARPVFSLAIRSYSNGTMITYGIPERTAVSLTLYAVSGKLVKSIYTGVREKGYFTVDLKRNGFTAGTYLLRMKAGSRTTATRLMLN